MFKMLYVIFDVSQRSHTLKLFLFMYIYIHKLTHTKIMQRCLETTILQTLVLTALQRNRVRFIYTHIFFVMNKSGAFCFYNLLIFVLDLIWFLNSESLDLFRKFASGFHFLLLRAFGKRKQIEIYHYNTLSDGFLIFFYWSYIYQIF